MMHDHNTCSTGGGCNKGGMMKCLIPIATVFAVLFGFQWLYHGVYMMPIYEATASMWRSQEEMQNLMWVCIVTKLVIAAAVSCLYCCMAKGAACGGKCPKTGAKFGLKVGAILGAHDFASYAWLPISMDMAVKWAVGDVIMGVLIGVALAYVSRLCKAEAK